MTTQPTPPMDWSLSTNCNVEMWNATPEPGTRYMVAKPQTGKFWIGYLTTGTSHKFCRPITEESTDLKAVQLACETHWLNDRRKE